MKLFFKYLKYHRLRIEAFFLCAAVFFTSFALYKLPLAALIYSTLLSLLVLTVFAVIGYLREKKRLKKLEAIKHRSAELIDSLPSPSSLESEEYSEIITRLCQAQREALSRSAAEFSDMIDYYTVWAHQIKTPIASMKLRLQNEDSPESRSLQYELGRIERYVEMVLTYLRLDSKSTDFVIREYDLDEIVRAEVKKLAGDFILKRIALDYKKPGFCVLTDEKWLSFVIAQVLSNALKYTPSGTVFIYSEEPKTLCIRDTGIGIAPEDLPRIFENGYTGLNGRTDKAASGIGLHLCKRICLKLGHEISAESEPGKGTLIRIRLKEYEEF